MYAGDYFLPCLIILGGPVLTTVLGGAGGGAGLSTFGLRLRAFSSRLLGFLDGFAMTICPFSYPEEAVVE